MTKLKEALTKSETPEAKQQLAGWKVVKAPKPMPDGNIVYIARHQSRGKGADYNDPARSSTRRSPTRPSRRRSTTCIAARSRATWAASAAPSPSTCRSNVQAQPSRRVTIEPRAGSRRSWLFLCQVAFDAKSRLPRSRRLVLLRGGRRPRRRGHAASAAAQPPPPAPPAPAADAGPAPRRAPAGAAAAARRPHRSRRRAGLLFNTVRPERVVDFETVHRLPAGGAARSRPTRRCSAQAKGWRIFKAAEPGPERHACSTCSCIDPAVPGADYGLGRILADAYPGSRSQEIWKLYTGSVTGGGSLLNLTPVSSRRRRHPPAAPRLGDAAPRVRTAAGRQPSNARRVRSDLDRER